MTGASSSDHNVPDDLCVELVGHACLLLRSSGRTLVTDPWWAGPVSHHSAFLHPPPVHDLDRVARECDALYISHIHPDHLHAPTLDAFPRRVPVFIAEHRSKRLRDAVHHLGFPLVEAPFCEAVPVSGTDFEICILPPRDADTDAYDSAAVVRAPSHTTFNNNDCMLSPEQYRWVRKHFAIDFAFLGFSPASFYPVCFEMPREERSRRLTASCERRYRDFLEAAALLHPRVSVPFASDIRFLRQTSLWKNAQFNSPHEAVRRAQARGLCAEVLSPGDGIGSDGRIRRLRPLPSDEEADRALRERARAMQSRITELDARDPAVRSGLADELRCWILERWRRHRHAFPGVRECVIAYVIQDDPHEERFHFDFSRPDGEIFQRGLPRRYDMRYTYPAVALQQMLDGRMDIDELHFADGVSVHQIRWARELGALLRAE